MNFSKRTLGAGSIIFVFLFATGSEARFGGDGIFFDLNAYHGTTNAEVQLAGSPSYSAIDSQSTVYDLHLGYIFPNSWYLGIIDSMRSEYVLNSYGNYANAYGISVGFLGYGGVFFRINYLMDARTGEYTRGSGFHFEFGYKYELSNRWIVGVEITQRSLVYTHSDTSASLSEYRISEVLPMVSVGYLF